MVKRNVGTSLSPSTPREGAPMSNRASWSHYELGMEAFGQGDTEADVL